MTQVSVIIGSDSDLGVIEKGLDILKELDISHELRVLSAHRTPEQLHGYLNEIEEEGVEVVITAAGKANHLSGVAAASLSVPVIGVPISGSSTAGYDSLLSTVQMPGGVPIATVSLDGHGAKNAALLAARIIGLYNDEVKSNLEQYIESMSEEVMRADEQVRYRS